MLPLARILGLLTLPSLGAAQAVPSAPVPAAPVQAPAPASASLSPALRELSLNHLAEAERLARQQIEVHPADPAARYLLGFLLFREQRPADSLAAYTAAAQLRNPTASDLEVVASDYILLKDFADAEKWLRYATNLNPADPHLWYLLGRAQYNEDRNAEAATSFEHCLEMAPRDLRAEYNLGLAYERLQRPQDAAQAYRNAIAWQAGQAEQDPQPFLDLGTLLLTQGHPADALPLFQQAAHIAPDNPLIAQQQGLAFEALGRLPEAVTAFQRAATLAPNSEQPHFFLGRVLRRLGRTAEANAEYATVARILGAHSSTPTPDTEHRPTPAPNSAPTPAPAQPAAASGPAPAPPPANSGPAPSPPTTAPAPSTGPSTQKY